MMTKKPQKTDLQQEDHHHPRAHGSMMLAAKEEVEKEKEKGKERQTASASCLAKRPFRGTLLQQVVRAEDPVELLVEHFAVPYG